MTGPAPRIANAALQASVDEVIMQVDRDTVLRAAKVFHDESSSLRMELVKATSAPPDVTAGSSRFPMSVPGSGVYVGLCSKDPISGPAANSFNRKINKMLEPCWAYADDLKTAAKQLEDVARRYGYTEDEIENSFRDR